MTANRKSRWLWLIVAIILGLAIIRMLPQDVVTEFRLWLMKVDVAALQTEKTVNIGFRCSDDNVPSAIDIVEMYLDRHGLSIDTIYVHDPVGDRGLEKICRMKRMPGVAGLSIYSRMVSNDGLRSLEAAAEVKRLVLQCPNVDCIGIECLVVMKSLKRLDLTASGIGDECLMSLVKLRSLEVLCIAETRISATAVDAFEKERPDVGVVR